MRKRIVCGYCIQAIESHEGRQFKHEVYVSEDTPCWWCEDTIEAGEEAYVIGIDCEDDDEDDAD